MNLRERLKTVCFETFPLPWLLVREQRGGMDEKTRDLFQLSHILAIYLRRGERAGEGKTDQEIRKTLAIVQKLLRENESHSDSQVLEYLYRVSGRAEKLGYPVGRRLRRPESSSLNR